MGSKETILIILTAAAANFAVTLRPTQLLRLLKYRYLKNLYPDKDIVFASVRVKPFDCPACLAFWTIFVQTVFVQSLTHSLTLSLAGAWIAHAMERKFPRYA